MQKSLGKNQFASSLLVSALAMGTLAACSPSQFSGSGATPASVAGNSASNGIVNGSAVTETDPVSISTVGIIMKMEKGTGICSGTLLSDRIVLTAAHCVDPEVKMMVIVFTKDFHNLSRDVVRPVTNAVVHPLWAKQDNNSRGDLALLLFKGGLPPGYAPAQMATSDMQLSAGDPFLVAGYGVANPESHEGTGLLRQTVMHVLGMRTPTEVVSDGRQTSICFGDSGGPAYLQHNGRIYIWGVASAVAGVDKCRSYAIHTDIATYEPWIVAISQKLSSLPATPDVSPTTPSVPSNPTVPSEPSKPVKPPLLPPPSRPGSPLIPVVPGMPQTL